MTQTSETPARNIFQAADAQVTVGNALYKTMVIDFTDDNPSRVATVVVGQYGAEQLMRQLAEQLGFEVVATEIHQAAGAKVRAMVAEADARDAEPGAPTFARLNAHRDAMRDLREDLRRSGVIAG